LFTGIFLGPRWAIDITLPTREQALVDWSRDRGFDVAVTQDGRYAEALLDRLGRLERLDVLSDERRQRILGRLASESRKKLVQRLQNEMGPKLNALGPDEFAEVLAERLRDVGMFLELEARDSAALGSAVGGKARAIEALVPLIEAGLVIRGQTVRCN